MSLFDFFRPAWRHSNPDVRAQAVRSLTDEDVRVLSEVALRDSDPGVRRLAVKRLRDREVLTKVAEHDADAELRALAGERVREMALRAALAAAPVEGLSPEEGLRRLVSQRDFAEVAKEAAGVEIRRAAVEKLSDQKLLATVALGALDPAVRKAAAAKVTELAALTQLARESEEKGIAIGALERIKDDKALATLVKNARLKAVRQGAQQRLGGGREDEATMAPAEAKRLRQRLTQICVAIEPYCRSNDDWAFVDGKLAEANDRWAEIGRVPGDESLRERFEKAKAQYAARKGAHEEEVRRRTESARAAEERRRRAEQEEERRKVVEAAASVAKPEPARAPEPAPAAEAAPPQKTPEDEAREREEAQRREAERAAALAEIAEAEAALAPLAESEDLKKLGAALKDHRPLVKKFAGKFAGSQDKAVQEARARLEGKLGDLSARFDSLREAEDWKRWTNLPKVEQLIKEAEALVEVLDTVEDKRAVPALLKELQARWKAAGPLPSKQSQALWDRFKKACDAAFAKCGEYFAQLDAARPENLKKKEELCEKAEALKESTDWKATSEALRALQEEWKTIGPVPEEQKDIVWKRFRAACDAFYERRAVNDKARDEERGENLKLKQALCAEAERLATSTDWRNTAERVKALQDEWKSIGPVPKEAGDDLWKRFRAACDRFFEARQQAFAAQDAERAENLTKKTKLCEEAEALAAKAAEADDPEPLREEAKELQRRWKNIGHVPRDVSDEIWSRFRTACDKVFEDPQEEAPAPEVLADATGVAGFTNRLRLDHLVSGEGQAPSPEGDGQSK